VKSRSWFLLISVLSGAISLAQTPVGGAQANDSTSPTASVPSVSKTQDAAPTNPQTTTPGMDPKTGKPLYETIKENWASLSVKGSELTPEPPLVGEVTEEPTYTRTLVALKWRPGDALDVYIVMPKGVTKPPAVLYLYNYMEDTERFKSPRWCENVTAGGVAAIGFVSALSGHRFHDRPMKQWFVSELQESLGSTVHDVKFILDYLESRGDIDMNRIGMFGQGSGGTIAILAAAADPRIKVIDVLEPWGHWPVWLAKSSVVTEDDPNKDRYTSKEFIKKVEPLDPVRWLPKLTSTAIRIQQIAEYDDSVPAECQKRMKAAAPKRAEVSEFDSTLQLATVEGGGRIFNWMKGELTKLKRPQSTSKSMAAIKVAGSGNAAVQHQQ